MVSITADDDLARAIGSALTAADARVAVVETTGGGLISARLLSAPGASAYFDRGVVAYSARSKHELTGIDSELLRSEGSVSVASVTAMARGLRDLAGVDYAVAESGIAGPQGSRRTSKPPGYVIIAVAGPADVRCVECQFDGDRIAVMTHIAERALAELLAALTQSA